MFRSVLFGIPIGITFVDCFGYIAKVDGISMQPALNPEPTNTNDFVFLSRWAAKSFKYERGDIVCIISPKDPEEKIIKRIIGVEGDLVRTINYKQRYITVPKGHCWVEGDHTGHSLDSNLFGPLAIGLITARASQIVWPPSRWGKLECHIPTDRLPINLNTSAMNVDILESLEHDDY